MSLQYILKARGKKLCPKFYYKTSNANKTGNKLKSYGASIQFAARLLSNSSIVKEYELNSKSVLHMLPPSYPENEDRGKFNNK